MIKITNHSSGVIQYGPYKHGDDYSNLPEHIQKHIADQVRTYEYSQYHSLFITEDPEGKLVPKGELVGVWKPDREEEVKIAYGPYVPYIKTMVMEGERIE